MLIVRILGTFAIIPATVFLTMGFFVLLAVQSIEVQGLRFFGYFVACLLCLTALLMLFVGGLVLLTGRHPAAFLARRMDDESGQET